MKAIIVNFCSGIFNYSAWVGFIPLAIFLIAGAIFVYRYYKYGYVLDRDKDPSFDKVWREKIATKNIKNIFITSIAATIVLRFLLDSC